MITVTKEALAELIDGIEYPACAIRAEWENVAKANNLIIAYGMSDDLLEVAGAESDEFGAWEGTTEIVGGIGFKAEWCPDDRLSWKITCTEPSATFKIVEDGDVYCEGLVCEAKAVSE